MDATSFAFSRDLLHNTRGTPKYFENVLARQDRKDKPRVSIGAKLVADLLSVAGIDRLITMDLHADQIQGFFNIPVDHLYASAVFLPYIESLKLKDLVIATPDVGGSKRASTN